jgi:O-antigen/teichoic acid export membrane protein
MLALGVAPGRTVLLSAWLVALFIGQSYDALVVYRRAFAFSAAIEALSTGLIVIAIVLAGPRLEVDVLVVVFAAVAAARAVALGWRLQPRVAAVVERGNGAHRAPGPRGSVVDELRASFPFFALTFTGALQARLDLYVVAALLSPAALGAYGVLTSFVAILQGSAAALLAPLVRPLYRVSRTSVLAIAGRFSLVGLGVATAGSAGTWLALTGLYRIEVPALAIAAAWAAVVPCFLYTPLVYLWFRNGRTRVVIAGSLVGIGVGLTAGVVLAPSLGIAGAMLSAALAQVAIAAFHVVQVAWNGLRTAAPAGGPAVS